MYGLVNRAIEELVIDRAGEAVWQAVKLRAGVQIHGFVSMATYDDSITFALVDAAGQLLGMTRAQVLRAFGRHWVLYTAEQGYGALLRMAGTGVCEFLTNLDALHARIGMALPDLEAPSFLVSEEPNGELIVRYYSERPGLAPMVIGLLEGLGEMLETPYDVEQVTTTGSGCDHEVFRMQPAWVRV